MDDYYLKGQATNLVQPPSKLTVLYKAAAAAGGSLQMVFELLLTQSGSQLKASPTNVLMAVGPLAGGQLQFHTFRQPTTVALGSGIVTSLPPLPDTSATSSGNAPALSPQVHQSLQHQADHNLYQMLYRTGCEKYRQS